MTLEEFWNKPIEIKWFPVHIQGPRIKDWLLRKELVARLDSSLNGYLPSYKPFAADIADVAGIPYFYSSKEDIINKPDYNKIDALREKWIEWWGASKWSGMDNTIFEMNTFDDSFKDCFFNPKTGKVGLTHNVGRYIYNMSELRPEIEWFAKEFPEVELYITFEELDKSNEKDCWATKSFATLHLKDGNIELSKTRKVKEIKNSISHSNLYYKVSNFFSKILRNIFSHLTPEKYNYWHNYILFGNKTGVTEAGSYYYSAKEFFAIIEWWYGECYNYWEKNNKED